MSKDITRTLLDLKDQLAHAKSETIKAQGAFEQLTKQLKEKYDVHSVKEAEALLKTMESDLKRLDKDIEEQTKALEERYLQEHKKLRDECI